MRPRSIRSTVCLLGIGTAVLCATQLALMANAASAPRFHLEEATIADVHRAIRAKEITAEQLVQRYFKRIEAYNGTCVKGEVDPATGLMYGEITPVENAGQVNAYVTLNIRGKRSKTPPKIMEQMASDPSAGMPTSHGSQYLGIRSLAIMSHGWTKTAASSCWAA